MASHEVNAVVANSPQHDSKKDDADIFNHDLLVNPRDVDKARKLYPAVVDVLTGLVRFDTFEGHWGDQSQLDRFLQAYAAEKTLLEARKRGHRVSEQVLEDGTLKLQVIEG